MNEQDKLLVETMYNAFLNAIHKMCDDSEETKAEMEYIKYGLELLKKDSDPKIYSRYAMMWAAYYYGIDFGLEITRIVAGETT